MDTHTVPTADPAGPELRVELVGRNVRIVDPDSDMVMVDLADLPTLRAHLDHVAEAAERILAQRKVSDGLRALADALDANPDLVVPTPPTVSIYQAADRWIETEDQVRAFAARFDADIVTDVRDDGSVRHECVVKFGPVALRAWADIAAADASEQVSA